MSRVSEFARMLWLEMQLGAPAPIQRTVIPFLHRAKEMGRLLLQPYMPLSKLSGQNKAGSLTVTYGGLGYAKPFLKSLLFSEDSVEEGIGRLSTQRPGEQLASIDSDMIIIESGKFLIRKLDGLAGAIALPFRVQFVLDLGGEWQEVEARFHHNVRRNIRKAHAYDTFEYETSRRKQDLDMFYHTMYLPTVQERHGELATILPITEAYQLLRHGQLFLLKQDGVYVCGSLYHAQQGIIEFKEMGVLDGDQQLLKRGVVDALNYLRIRWAHEARYQGLSFGDSWPFMSGLFRFKRKWGTTVSISPFEHKQIWIRIQRNTPAVAHFMTDNPCLVASSTGKLQGLVVVDDPEHMTHEARAKLHRTYMMPGMDDLVVRSVVDFLGV